MSFLFSSLIFLYRRSQMGGSVYIASFLRGAVKGLKAAGINQEGICHIVAFSLGSSSQIFGSSTSLMSSTLVKSVKKSVMSVSSVSCGSLNQEDTGIAFSLWNM